MQIFCRTLCSPSGGIRKAITSSFHRREETDACYRLQLKELVKKRYRLTEIKRMLDLGAVPGDEIPYFTPRKLTRT